MIVSPGRFSKPRLTKLRLLSLPSSSTIFIELEPMSKPATLFFLPNIISCSLLASVGCIHHRKVFSCSHPNPRVLMFEDLCHQSKDRKRKEFIRQVNSEMCQKPAFVGCVDHES